MHGRLKIKEKSEIELEKKLKYEKKCKFYKTGLDKCLEAKSNHDYNEEIIKLSFDLLTINPDVYTLWNLRKEYLLIEHKKFIEKKIDYETRLNDLNEEKLVFDEQNLDLNEDLKKQIIETFQTFKNEFNTLCNNELDLIKLALTKNEKSYCAWQHRFWILNLIPEPNFKNEFAFCDFYLQSDGRNFHCWDYRSLICKLAKRDLIEEINFSCEKIKEDFSLFSYSNLYYRSLLLTKASKEKKINFNQIWNQEYELIESALFTEPNDQAYWFYLKWLLSTNFGTCFDKYDNLLDEAQLLEKIIFVKESNNLIFYFDKQIKLFPFNSIEVIYDDNLKQVYSISNVNYALGFSSKIWSLKIDSKNVEYLVLNDFKKNEFKNFKVDDLKKTVYSNFIIWENERYHSKNHNYELKIKDDQLEKLFILLELEKNNKWLNMILSNLTHKDQIQILNKLITIDVLRKNYYYDQQSKINITNFIKNMNKNHHSIRIQNLGLTAFYFAEQFAHLSTLDMSENKFIKLNSSFNCLLSLRQLIMDRNQIAVICKTFQVPSLQILSIQNNILENKLELDNLQNCINLKKIYLFGNPVANYCDGKKNKAEIIKTFCEFI